MSNENDDAVYFDNLTVTDTRGRIVEENHYYAFGLKIVGISSTKLGDPNEGMLKNLYQYQGDFSEMDEDIGWNDFALRNYDAQTGRWIQQDPFNEFPSPYTGMGNDPVNNIDPSGGWAATGLFEGLSQTGIKAVTTLSGAIVGTAVDILSGGDGGKGFLIGAEIGLASNLNGIGFATKGIGAINKIPGGPRGPAFVQNLSFHLKNNGVESGLVSGYFRDYKEGPNLGGEISLLYQNLNAPYISFDWIQSFSSNRLLNSQPSPMTLQNDKDKGQKSPFYYNDYEYFQLHTGNNYVSFYDNPDRKPDGGDIYWNGELSLVGLDRTGIYHSLITIKYGFMISKSGKLIRHSVTVSKVSPFQEALIKSAKPRFWTNFIITLRRIFKH